MQVFEYMYKIPQNENKTTYGSLRISNIIFEPKEIENKLPDIIFKNDNLKHMFVESDLSCCQAKM